MDLSIHQVSAVQYEEVGWLGFNLTYVYIYTEGDNKNPALRFILYGKEPQNLLPQMIPSSVDSKVRPDNA